MGGNVRAVRRCRALHWAGRVRRDALARYGPPSSPRFAAVGSTLSVTNPTLLDLAKTLDPDGKVADIVEILNQTNESSTT
jgi:hypothetical protein